MWDPEKTYDDLEYSIFEKNAYMWDPTEFYDDLEHFVFKIMFTCGTDVGLLHFFRAYGITKRHGIGNA
jgi:hypothetical protein